MLDWKIFSIASISNKKLRSTIQIIGLDFRTVEAFFQNTKNEVIWAMVSLRGHLGFKRNEILTFSDTNLRKISMSSMQKQGLPEFSILKQLF